MQIAYNASQTSIYLLWKRVIFIIGAQARFNVPKRNLVIKCREARNKCGRGIALSQDQIRLRFLYNLILFILLLPVAAALFFRSPKRMKAELFRHLEERFGVWGELKENKLRLTL